MPRTTVFIRLKPILFLLVERFQYLVVDLDIVGEIRPSQLQVLDIDAFLGEEPILVGLVVRQHLRLIDFDLIEERIGRKQRVGDFPFLLEQRYITGEFGRRVERRHADPGLQVNQAQLFPLLLLECRRRKA